MRKSLLFFVAGMVLSQNAAVAVTIKKAAPVATKQTSTTDAGASLLPTVMNLVSGVQQLSKQQKELTAECIPTSSEIKFVNDMMKEWAKSGMMTAEEAEDGMGMDRCESATGGYEHSVRLFGEENDKEDLCFDYFGSSSDKDMVWYEFPMATLAYYCNDGSLSSCGEKNRVHMSNIYDVFNLIEFDPESDYTEQEAKTAGKIIAKIENCSNAKLSARKKALWGNFLNTAIGSIGQKTSSVSIMDMVSGVTSQGGGGTGVLQSLPGLATQLFQQK